MVSSSWKNFATISGTAVSLFCLALGICWAPEFGWEAALIASSVVGFVASLFVVGLTLAVHHQLKTHLPTVELHAERLIVHYGNRTKTASLTECHFHLGRAWQMRLEGGGVLHSWVPVILIDLPPRSVFGPLNLRPRNVVAVGYSDETRQKWEQALTASVNPPPLTLNAR